MCVEISYVWTSYLHLQHAERRRSTNTRVIHVYMDIHMFVHTCVGGFPKQVSAYALNSGNAGHVHLVTGSLAMCLKA